MTWAALWHSNNRLDGLRESIIYENQIPKLFPTRKEAREWIVLRYGYIKTRQDLRREPHGWRMPRAVKVEVILKESTDE